jgi:hypothetical protein
VGQGKAFQARLQPKRGESLSGTKLWHCGTDRLDLGVILKVDFSLRSPENQGQEAKRPKGQDSLQAYHPVMKQNHPDVSFRSARVALRLFRMIEEMAFVKSRILILINVDTGSPSLILEFEALAWY